MAFVGIRVLGVLALWGWAFASGAHRKMPHILLSLRWDSLWYSRIASHGYGYSVHTRSGDLHSDLAFFPLLPMLERAGHEVMALSVSDVGLGVSVVASLAAALGIFAVTEHVTRASALEIAGASGGARFSTVPGVMRTSGGAGPVSAGPDGGLSAPFVAVVLWAALPVGVVEWMAYSESLFTALAAWGLYCVMTRRWVSAGWLAAAAGLTRPVGVGVVLAVWVGAVLASGIGRAAAASRADERAAVRDRVGRFDGFGWTGHRPANTQLSETGVRTASDDRRREGLRMVLGVVLAPLGMASYVLWVAHRTGRGLAGYLDVQAGWRNGFDGGVTFARFVAAKFASPGGAMAGGGLMVGVALALWAVVACFRSGRLPWPVLMYVVVLVALALGAKGYFGSKPRFFVPIFPLLIPPAGWIAERSSTRRGSRGVIAALVLLTVGSAAFGAFWLNGSGPP